MNSPLFSIEARMSSTAMYKSLMTSLLACCIFFGCVCDVLSGFSTKQSLKLYIHNDDGGKFFYAFVIHKKVMELCSLL